MSLPPSQRPGPALQAGCSAPLGFDCLGFLKEQDMSCQQPPPTLKHPGELSAGIPRPTPVNGSIHEREEVSVGCCWGLSPSLGLSFPWENLLLSLTEDSRSWFEVRVQLKEGCGGRMFPQHAQGDV